MAPMRRERYRYVLVTVILHLLCLGKRVFFSFKLKVTI